MSLITDRLFSYLKRTVADARPPDFTIMNEGTVYLNRWWVIPRNMVFCIYLHEFRGSDEDRALHDHRSINLSVLLSGYYNEHTKKNVVLRIAGTPSGFKFRLPWTAHRIELISGMHVDGDADGNEVTHRYLVPCWTLFFTGPNLRNWGFQCPKGWRPFQVFTEKTPTGTRGCD